MRGDRFIRLVHPEPVDQEAVVRVVEQIRLETAPRVRAWKERRAERLAAMVALPGCAADCPACFDAAQGLA